ncbi:MAG: putative collagen-binding domain-containing protein, partial [Chitinophagaceae bacterium]
GMPLTVRLDRMGANPVLGWWYNPRTGRPLEIGMFKTGAPHRFIPPSSGDWVLVIDKASDHFPPPGGDTH